MLFFDILFFIISIFILLVILIKLEVIVNYIIKLFRDVIVILLVVISSVYHLRFLPAAVALTTANWSLEVYITNTSTIILAIQVVYGLFNFVFYQGGTALRLHELFLLLRQAAASKKEPANDLFRQPNAVFFDLTQTFTVLRAV